MKYLSLIMAIYVALLLAFPCQDCGVHAGVPNHTASDCSGHNDQDGNECHHCSPFCACNCCSTSAVISVHFFQSSITELFIPIESEFFATTCKGIKISIWQPPKLS